MRSFSIHALSVLFILAKIPKGSTMKRGLKLSMRNCMFRISILAVFFVGCSAHERKPETDSLDAKDLIRQPAQLGANGISQIVSSLQARYGVGRDRKGNEFSLREDGAAQAENQRLREELRAMKDRLAVLERLATDNNDSGARLDREIEKLRDRT